MIKIHQDLAQLQRNQNEKQSIQIGLKSLIWFWVNFFLPTILIYYNNNNQVVRHTAPKKKGSIRLVEY